MSALPVEVELRSLRVGYNRKPLLPSLSAEVRRGELWALLGPNGAGKTTMLRTLLGLLAPVSGSVVRPRGRVAYVPQRSGLHSGTPARVIDLVRAGTDHGWSFLDPTYPFRHRKRVREVLELTDTWDLRRQAYSHLSEGQKQRVLVARALATAPSTLILDEPTSAMDLGAEQRLMELLTRLREDKQLAIIMVSHHLHVVLQHATHVIVVDRDRDVAKAGTRAEVSGDSFLQHHGCDLEDCHE